MEPSLSPFAAPDRHAAIAELIRRRSSNPADIRQLGCAGLDAAAIHDVLDLGCGFGVLAGVLGQHSAPDARFVGVDACPENGVPFLAAVEAAGRRGVFECRHLAATLPWADARFDLVVASYSLYYFVDLLPAIPRVLRPTGTFVAVTHGEATFRTLCLAAGIEESRSPLRLLLRGFNAENGEERLRTHFAAVERLDYLNTLRFEPQHLAELLDYAGFKLPLLLPDRVVPETVLGDVRQRLTDLLRVAGAFVMDKHDVIFRCRGPRGA
jgi:SAM-dependent methyltransferase